MPSKSALIGLNYFMDEGYDMGELEEKDNCNEGAELYIDEMNNCLRTMYELYLHGKERSDNLHESSSIDMAIRFIKNWSNGNYDDEFRALQVYSEVELLKSTDLQNT